MHIRKTLNDQMGGDKSYCFLKAPERFVKQVTDVAEIFTMRAHLKLMNKVKKKGGKLMEDVWSEKAKEELLKIRDETS